MVLGGFFGVFLGIFHRIYGREYHVAVVSFNGSEIKQTWGFFIPQAEFRQNP